MTKQFALIVLLTLTLGTPYAQQQEPPPDQHSLAYCVNHGGFPDTPMVEPHICKAMCDKNCDEGGPEKGNCLTYCRPDHCHCLAECDNHPEEPKEN